MGGSITDQLVSNLCPGLVVMGDKSCFKGRGFESRYRLQDGLPFFTFICCKIILFVDKTEINEKEVGVGPF